MSLVHLMFPKYNSLIRYPPSLLSGFLGADFPPFYQYYEDTKTAFALLLPFSFLRYRYRYDTDLFLSLYLVSIFTKYCPVYWGRVWPFFTLFRTETLASPKFPGNPLVHLLCYPTPTVPKLLAINEASVLSLIFRLQRLRWLPISELNHTAFALAVYTSCHHLWWLCKTRFRLVANLYRIGLVTYRISTKDFKELFFLVLLFRTYLGATVFGLNKYYNSSLVKILLFYVLLSPLWVYPL